MINDVDDDNDEKLVWKIERKIGKWPNDSVKFKLILI